MPRPKCHPPSIGLSAEAASLPLCLRRRLLYSKSRPPSPSDNGNSPPVFKPSCQQPAEATPRKKTPAKPTTGDISTIFEEDVIKSDKDTKLSFRTTRFSKQMQALTLSLKPLPPKDILQRRTLSAPYAAKVYPPVDSRDHGDVPHLPPVDP